MSLHFRESAAGESRYAVQSEWASEGELKVRRGRYRLYAQADGQCIGFRTDTPE
ncbi:hypothetical protein [Ruminococcus sp.]|uniref:hypothetical protein n=1 Tax=Ruminococcus sp. TaxID=41978 RepID=UPI0025E8C4B0|nr:hypothetical protein [Ruminococcus sp.]MBQ6250425.1 hypothetical protein [Ruminococcus sp.]